MRHPGRFVVALRKSAPVVVWSAQRAGHRLAHSTLAARRWPLFPSFKAVYHCSLLFKWHANRPLTILDTLPS